MQNFKNNSKEILEITRPLFHLHEEELAAMIVQAEFMFEQAGVDPESIASKIMLISSHRMIHDAVNELAQRN